MKITKWKWKYVFIEQYVGRLGNNIHFSLVCHCQSIFTLMRMEKVGACS